MRRLMLVLLVAWGPAVGAEAPPREQFDVRIPVADRGDVAALATIVPLDVVIAGDARATLTPEQFARLEASGRPFTIEEPPPAKALVMCSPGWEFADPPPWTCYPTWRQYRAYLERLAASSDTIRLVDLGPTTNEIRPHRLLALAFEPTHTDGPPAPKVLLTSTMHGDETTGYALLLRLAWDLAQAPSDPVVADLRGRTEIWLNPLANPDGTFRGGDDTVAGAIRYYTTAEGLSSGVDPNRNFPDPHLGDDPDGNPRWRETEAFMALAETERFHLSANLHGGAELVNYPWDGTCDRHPDDDWLFAISLDWARAAQLDGPPGVMDDCADPRCSTAPCVPGVTHGADWYLVGGGRQDFVTGFHHGRELTVELSHRKLAESDTLETHWTTHRRALLGFVETVHRGIAGTVTDPSGRPLEARVTVLGRDDPAAWSSVRTDPATGAFNRLLLAGAYDLVVSASGHAPKLVANVPVGPATTRVAVILNPAPRAPQEPPESTD